MHRINAEFPWHARATPAVIAGRERDHARARWPQSSPGQPVCVHRDHLNARHAADTSLLKWNFSPTIRIDFRRVKAAASARHSPPAALADCQNVLIDRGVHLALLLTLCPVVETDCLNSRETIFPGECPC